MEEEKDWKKLEQLVARIQAELAPDAKVTHNAKLPGYESETSRQIDVLLEHHIGQFPVRVVIDCKDYATPIDVKGVEEFQGLVEDVRAHKGVLVCPSGFTPSAKKKAKKIGMELYRPVDTGDHKWKAKASFPVVCDVRTCVMSFGMSMSAPYPMRFSEHPAYWDVFNAEAVYLDTPLKRAADLWNAGELPIIPGEHADLPIYGPAQYADNGHGMLVPVELSVSIHVERHRFYGQLPIEKMSGFFDEHTGHVVTNAFTTGNLDWDEVRRSWKSLAEGEEPPTRTALTVGALQCVGVED